jgi:hypothetical protein
MNDKSFIIKALCVFAVVLSLWVFARAQSNVVTVLPITDSIIVTIDPLPSSINSSFSEYAGRLLPDSAFLFTAMRNDAAEDAEHFFETNWYCYIYESKALPQERFAMAKPLPSTINHPKYFNSNFCLSEDGQRMILTRCERTGDGDLHCHLWESERRGDNWTKPHKFSSVINPNDYSSMQPCLVEYADYEVLYFSSNRPGGYGKSDIWYAVRKNGHFQSPVNLGPAINTDGDEVTPFYDKRSNMLYFSSDEHHPIGDFDIFCSEGALGRWQPVKHLDQPFNSKYNDFYFIVNQDSKSGFLSSNRPYRDMVDDDTCCNDIFYVEWSEPQKDTVIVPPKPDIHEKIASVLPITLYFQNDCPDPKSVSDTTDRDYLELYNAYIGDIQGYVNKSGEGLSGEEQRRAMYAVAGFMRDSVQTGYSRLQLLQQYLTEAMLNGDTVNLIISGFASPLHNSDYNKHLSSRRIVSLLNYLRKADNGFLLPYLSGEKSGLEVIVYPEGAVNHSFETDEVRETVFGLKAAKDRKIVITGQ